MPHNARVRECADCMQVGGEPHYGSLWCAPAMHMCMCAYACAHVHVGALWEPVVGSWYVYVRMHMCMCMHCVSIWWAPRSGPASGLPTAKTVVAAPSCVDGTRNLQSGYTCGGGSRSQDLRVGRAKGYRVQGAGCHGCGGGSRSQDLWVGRAKWQRITKGETPAAVRGSSDPAAHRGVGPLDEWWEGACDLGHGVRRVQADAHERAAGHQLAPLQLIGERDLGQLGAPVGGEELV